MFSACLLAGFFVEGGKMVTGFDEPATGRQLHTIALLCMKHKIKEPVEERGLTKGEAGRLIRRLAGYQPSERR